MNSNYSFLIQKLDKFIKKFYLNETLRGSIYFLAVLLISTLFFTTLEYFANFGTTPRLIIFWMYLLGNLALLAYWVLLPVARWARIGSVISHKTAAKIIGNHFPEVKDKLLNTLELHEENAGSRSLIEASIEQKIASLKPVPFHLAINFKSNRRYLKYALIPLAIVLLLMIQMPDVILNSSARIMSYNREFVPEAPFNFALQNENLEILLHDDFEFKLKMEGDELPATVRLNYGNNSFRMTRTAPNEFTYRLRNVEKSEDFSFEAAGFHSQNFELKVLPKPFLKSFVVELEYPKYLGKKNEALNNIGDFTIPEGTLVKWKCQTENADNLRLNMDGNLLKPERLSENTFRFARQIFNNAQYYVQSVNKYVPVNDSMGYGIQVIKDIFPAISVNMVSDTSSLKSYFFSGELSDDYGLTALTFNYRFTNSQNKEKIKDGFTRTSIGINSSNLQSFFYHWDLREMGYEAGDELEFYFEVWDNDGVNGRKSSKSKRMHIKAPSKNEVTEMVTEASNTIKDNLQNALKEAEKVQEELKDVENRLRNKKNLDWEDKKAISKLLERQKSLQNNIEKLNNEYKDMLKQQDEFKEIDERLREKHEELMKLFDQLMDEETKKLFDELQKLLDENKNNVEEKLEELNMDNSELEKELDAALEHFKQLEVEQKMEEAIEKLDELAKKQEELAEKTEGGEEQSEELQKQQEQLNEEFEKLQEDLDELEKLNNELEQPNDLDNTDEMEDDIKGDMKQSTDELKEGKNKKASEKQKSAGQKMDEMKKKMQENMESMEMESMELDYEALRRLMENLIYLSFEQEKLMNELGEIHSYNPKYVELAQRQMKLKGDAAMIEDSLVALSKKVMQINGFITREVGQLNYHMDKNIEDLSLRQINDARKEQQYVMTHTNNLAVMLSEVMDQMQQQMSQKMKGEQNCSKPGNMKMKGKKKGEGLPKKLGNMRQMQEQLNQQIGNMKKKMEAGERPLSKELAKTAAQQEALRRELQKLQEMKEEAGGKPSNELKEIEDMMDKTEEDIVNNNITNETLKRQQEIINKLLESEKAEREQEWDNTRESKTAEQISDPSKKAFEEYKKERLKEIELLNSVPPQLNGYYKQKVKEYFEALD
ncbi:DUF4175 domain-containing protein [bacterium]|nr:DUF4175 domain-containing protein [bacterium]